VAETTLVLGAGPAGLTAAYVLGKAGTEAVVLEADRQVGGLAKTVELDGFRFDLGGHRFFTKAREVEALWDEIMGDEFLLRPRMSRIYWNNRFLDYPLRGPDVIRKLGPVELTRCIASYAKAALTPQTQEESLEDWVSNRFGRRLFLLFYKAYTEKVWGVPTTEIRAEWAAQRIKGLSFTSAAKAAFFGNRGNKVKTLISEFHYPRYGPGQMWETMTQRIEEQGGEVLLEKPVERIDVEDGRVVGVTAAGEVYRPDAVISSLPLRDVVAMTQPRPPSPAMTRILTSSMNFMRKTTQWPYAGLTSAVVLHHIITRVDFRLCLCSSLPRTKKKPRRGALVKLRSLLLSWQNSDALP